MQNNRTVQTIFFANSEYDPTWVQNSEIYVKTANVPNEQYTVCVRNIVEGGWYECETPLVGDAIMIKRTTSKIADYCMMSLRAYSGKNVA